MEGQDMLAIVKGASARSKEFLQFNMALDPDWSFGAVSVLAFPFGAVENYIVRVETSHFKPRLSG
jgi:hypothetical protein